MANNFTREVIAEAKALGLIDIEVTNRKSKKMLVGLLPGARTIKLIFDQRGGDPRAPKNTVAGLRRAVRAATWKVAA